MQTRRKPEQMPIWLSQSSFHAVFHDKGLISIAHLHAQVEKPHDQEHVRQGWRTNEAPQARAEASNCRSWLPKAAAGHGYQSSSGQVSTAVEISL